MSVRGNGAEARYIPAGDGGDGEGAWGQVRAPGADGSADPRHASDPLAALERELTRVGRLMIAAREKLRYDLQRAHYAILVLLDESGPLSTGQIASKLALDNSTVTRQISAMKDRGLLTRDSDREDQRRTVIRITRAGRTQMSAVRKRRIEDTGALLQDWSDEDCRQLADLLSRYNTCVIDGLDRLAEGR